MGLKERIERLRDRHALIQWTLVCPECRKEFTAYGDIALEFLIAEWAKESGSKHDTLADMAAILEHDAWEFVDKRTGNPFLHLTDSRGSAVRPVFQAFRPLFGPPTQDSVDGGGANPEVARDGLGAPTLGVQRHHGRTAFPPLRDLVVGQEAAHEPQRYELFLKDALHRLASRTAPEANVAHARDLQRIAVMLDHTDHGRRDTCAVHQSNFSTPLCKVGQSHRNPLYKFGFSFEKAFGWSKCVEYSGLR